MSIPDLTIVLPCYNAASFVHASLTTLTAYLHTLPLRWEILAVDDGSQDGTRELLAQWDGPNFRWVGYTSNRGKGAAVKTGMLAAPGRQRIFTDLDLPYELSAIERCYERLAEGDLAVFGSRLLPESSQAITPPLIRRIGSRLFAAVAGLVIGRADLDTQCGFKGFNGTLADALFPLLRIDGFAFDVELSYLLTAAGVDITTIPVRLVNHDVSTVTILGSGLRSFLDVGRIAIWQLAGKYRVDVHHQLRPE